VSLLIEKRRSGYRATARFRLHRSRPSRSPIQQARPPHRGQFPAVLPRFNILYRFLDDINGLPRSQKGGRSATVNAGATRDQPHRAGRQFHRHRTRKCLDYEWA